MCTHKKGILCDAHPEAGEYPRIMSVAKRPAYSIIMSPKRIISFLALNLGILYITHNSAKMHVICNKAHICPVS